MRWVKKRMGLCWRLFRYVRWAVLVCLCVASGILVEWSRNYDPRFFHFLGTPPGRLLSRVMNWPTVHNLPPTDKAYAALTEQERLLKRQLQEELDRVWPSHEVRLVGGEVLRGKVESRDEQGLWFTEYFGATGTAEMFLPSSSVRAIRLSEEQVPSVTWRDVSFQNEYPEFELVHRKHYTVLTDASYYEISSSVDELERLHREFIEVFGPAIRYWERGRSMQVLFFSDEQGYRDYQGAFAPTLEDSAGFYAPLQDRMVVFNQFHSARSEHVRSQVNEQFQEMLSGAYRSADRDRILAARERTADRLREYAKDETYATLRHEGSHHLSYTYGLLSSHHAENGWLVEGLAVYCETEQFGDLSSAHLTSLNRMMGEERWLGFRKLVNSRDPKMLQAFEPEFHPHEAYSAAWSLVHYLMTPQNRSRFFDYMRFVRDPENLNVLVTEERAALLARQMGTTPEALSLDWKQHVRSL